jgi:hypothetical protein
MITKKQFISFFVALAILIGFVVLGFRTSTEQPHVVPTSTDQIPNPSQEVDKVTVHEQNAHYTIDAVYPKTNSDAITTYFKNYVDDQIAQFKDDTSWVNDTPSAADSLLTLDISYTSAPSALVQNYIFSVNSYTGGAHGMQVRKTFSFNKEGQLLTVSSLFKNGLDGLSTFAALAQKELLKREGAQESWITDGAGAKEENYQSFVVMDTGVKVLFDPYQVAPYSDGSIDITIPLSSFKSIANPELFTTQ